MGETLRGVSPVRREALYEEVKMQLEFPSRSDFMVDGVAEAHASESESCREVSSGYTAIADVDSTSAASGDCGRADASPPSDRVEAQRKAADDPARRWLDGLDQLMGIE